MVPIPGNFWTKLRSGHAGARVRPNQALQPTSTSSLRFSCAATELNVLGGRTLDEHRMIRRTISQRELTGQLLALGVERGGVLLVHTAFSKVAPVEGGPHGLIAAIRDTLGPTGTLVMPSMTDDDEHPFDPTRTPCVGMGVIADTFWKLPGVVRSDSPHAFAASGPRAAEITAPHPISVPHGHESPVGRIYELGGQVLLLGVGHDANTTIHLAEAMAGVRYRRRKHLTIIREGRPARYAYDEIDHCCENFNLMDQWLEKVQRQRRGTVGYAEARLIGSRDIVEIAVGRIRENETVFLHPHGVDIQCDEARTSIPDSPVMCSHGGRQQCNPGSR